MAMTHPSLVPALLLAVVASTTTIPAAFANPPIATASDSLTKACNKTTYGYASACVDVLRRFSPESATASPHRLAEISYQYLLKAGDALSRELDGAVAAAAKNKRADEGYRNCLDTLDGNVKRYLRSVSRFAPEHGAAEFSAAKNNLREILDVPSNSGVSCPDNAVQAEPAVKKTYSYEDMLQVTLDLMKAATAPEEAARKRKEEDDAAKLALEEKQQRNVEEDNARLYRQIGWDPIVKACNETAGGGGADLVSCVPALRSYPEKEVVAATPRRLAEMMCGYLVKKGQEVAAEVSRAAVEAKAKGKSKSAAACVQGYDDVMSSYMSSIAGGLPPEKSFDEAIKKLEKIWTNPADPTVNCTAKDLADIPVIAKFNAFYQLIVATGDAMQSVQHKHFSADRASDDQSQPPRSLLLRDREILNSQVPDVTID